MLKIFRSNTKFIIWITVAALVLLFGAGSIVDLVNSKKSGRFQGEAFGKPVTFQDYKQFYIATRLFMPSSGPNEDPDMIRGYTWQNIIYAREAKKEGLKATDEEVQREIANNLKQQGLVNLTSEQYKIWLAHLLPHEPSLTPHEFEEGLREFIRIQKLLRIKVSSFTPAGIGKITDTKAKEAAITKQKEAFMKWTNEVNARAAFKDYFALPKTEAEEEPLSPSPKK